jgi:hypothetical protein
MVMTAQPAWAGKKGPVEAIRADLEMPEESLLDVGIQVFDPGIPEDVEKRNKMLEEGVFEDVRKSEARYIPIQLKRTLQSTGFWGAVRLVPAANSTDVMITGTILKSHGKDLEVKVKVVDALGKKWLEEKYKQEADIATYASDKARLQDPYQSVYNRIANDILKKRRKLKDEYVAKIRTVSRLRFASELAPAAFGDYLEVDKKGRYKIERLPSDDDPMLERVSRIRERDYMFIDTLNEYYADFYTRMDEPYDNWRAFSYEEQVALEKLRSQARLEKILGAAAIIGGIVSTAKGGRTGSRVGEVAVMGGMAAIMDGMAKSEESNMHLETLRELASSLDSEVAPMLLDVEGEVMRLTGSVETQYATWRGLLRRIFAEETGLWVDPNAEAMETPKETSGH